MNEDICTLKLRFLTLVVNTGDLINERTTPTMGIGHALLAPVALTLVYICVGVLAVSGLRKRPPSQFLAAFLLVCCCGVEAGLALFVFRQLQHYEVSTRHVAMVLNGVMPTIIVILLSSDLIIMLLSSRDQRLELPESPRMVSSINLMPIR